MKVGIVAVNNLKYSPYVDFYVDICHSLNIECEVIYPKRNGFEDDYKVNTVCLPWNCKHNSLINYFSYFRNVKKTVKKQKYDYLILLTSISAVFLASFVKKNYYKKYIVDIRDYTYEKIPVYFKLQQMAVTNSGLNVISSYKFTDFLPKSDYKVCHNINVPQSKSTYNFSVGKDREIIIGYVGAISYVEQCKKLIDIVKADSRFRLYFYGAGVGESAVSEYVKYINSDNIKMFGSYRPDEKRQIIEKVDILFNAYGNGSFLVDTALSNKLYDALYYKKFLLTSPDTYMSELSGELAYSIDFNKISDLNELYLWYCERDCVALGAFAENLLEEFVTENAETKSIICEILKQIKE